MKKKLFLYVKPEVSLTRRAPVLLLLCWLLAACTPQTGKTPFEYVDPFIGTGGHGHTYPGATMPFGMVQLSPDTRLEGWDGCSGYHFSDSLVYGFSHTHLSGTGVSDYGDILLMPTTGTYRLNNGADGQPGYRSGFRHETETAQPGYYAVHLDDYDIDVELTTSLRAGLHRYRFSTDTANLIIDLNHRDKVLEYDLRMSSPTEVTGFRISTAWAQDQRVYFVAQFSHPIIDTTLQGKVGAFRFDVSDTKELLVRVGISPVDVEGPRKNLEAEIPHWEFEQIRAEAKAAWETEFNRVTIEQGEEESKTLFYTALYHNFIVPNLFTDVDGRYRGMDGEIHASGNTQVYTVFSLWDTYRGTHPLYTLLQRDRTRDFLRTFLLQYQQGGRLPVWELAGNETDCMIGYHSVSVIADAYVKGIRDFDTQLALEAMKHSANTNLFGLEAYRNQGFIASGQEAESVSKTLEYAYDDWCIGKFAQELGLPNDAQPFFNRSFAYQNLYDPESGFLRARSNGGWWKPFDPSEVNFNYTEANAWQYSLAVQHDINGLMDMMGGPDKMAAHLDALFSANSETTGREQADITGLIGQYAHGNEPSHHMAYLYNFVGQPWKTQEKVNQIMREQYHAAPDGLSGNEDCGQMSAWYVLSAMGFYPVTPGTDVYVIGVPHFKELTLHLENQDALSIQAPELSPVNRYIQSVEYNGTLLPRSYILHEELMHGGELIFHMGPTPSLTWGVEEKDRPVQRALDATHYPAPWFDFDSRTFTDSLVVTLQHHQYHPESEQLTPPYLYVWKGEDINQGKAYSPGDTLVLRQSTVVNMYADTLKIPLSSTVKSEFSKIKGGQSIQLSSTFASQYAAGGENALIDQLRGGPDFRTGLWQGFQQDLEAVVDLGSPSRVTSVGLGCLQDIKSWIWMPKSIQFSFSQDGQNWKDLPVIITDVPETQYGATQKDFRIKVPANAANTRFIKVKAVKFGVCPEWHLGAGGQAWIFADEILIE